MSFSTQTTNTPYFNTRPNSTQTISTQNPTSTQTGPLNFSTTQPAKQEDCQCEDNKPLLPFQSDFARQLHESEVMRRRNPQTRMQREIAVRQPIEYIQQQQTITPKQAISHIPQQVISHTQYPHHTSQEVLQDVIKHNSIENMETDYKSPALEYTPQQALQQPALQHTQHQAISHMQQPALQHTPQQQQVLQYSQQLQQALQPTALQDTQSKMELGYNPCLLYTSPSPRDMRRSRMPSSA